jgi:DNA-directed RNA polymerase specialized sigma24 family protein
VGSHATRNPIDNEQADIRDSLPDRDLLRQLADGDVHALHFLRKRHETAVYALVFALLNDAVDTEHVVSETFLELSRRAGGIGKSGESVHSVLRTIARARAQALRATRAQPSLRPLTA